MELRINPFDPRPCYANGRKALCHGLDTRSGYALVEYEDGTVDSMVAMAVRFTDSGVLFDEYAWDEAERGK